MLSQTILKMLNEQVTHELRNRNVYLAMRSYFNSKSLDGFASFMNKQSDGEKDHADKFMAYIQDHKDVVEIGTVDKPLSTFKSAQDAFEEALKLEQGTTAKIKAIYKAAAQEDDFATQAMLDWFVTEQVEEETVIKKLLEKLQGIGSAYAGLIILDESLKG